MKSKNFLLGILAIMLVFTMTVVGCGEDTINDIVKKALSYTSTDSAGKTYILVITGEGSGNTGAKGDSYELTIKENGQPDKVSKGTITEAGANGALKLQPNNPGSETFDVTANSGQMTSITGNITVGEGEGEKVTAPGTVTPQEKPSGDGITIDGWTWETYTDDSFGGMSSITMTQGSGNDNKKLTFSGNVKLVPGERWGDAGVNAKPNSANLTALKNADSFSFKCKGDGKEYRVAVITSDVTDYNYHHKYFTASTVESTITIAYSDLNQQDWENSSPSVTLNKNNIIQIGFEVQAQTVGEVPYNITLWDLKVGGESNDGAFTSISAMAEWLKAQPDNTAATPYTVKLNVSDLGGNYNTDGSTAKALTANSTKYVNLDLSGSTIITIPTNAFHNGGATGCNTLISIILPDSVTSIGGKAFGNCVNLTSVNIPNKVTSFSSSDQFNRCTSLNAINVNAGNTAFSSQDGVVYNKDKSALVAYPSGKTDTTFTIPDSVTSIKSSAFYECSKLTSVTIPGNVTSIEGLAFYNCLNLASVNIPNKVTSIGAYAFQNCKLTSIIIPESVISIGNNAFDGCNYLTSVTFQGTIASDKLGTYPFMGDLREKYISGGKGTYTTTGTVAYNSTWTKQS
jgi:hypothetical protein